MTAYATFESRLVHVNHELKFKVMKKNGIATVMFSFVIRTLSFVGSVERFILLLEHRM